MMDWSDRHCRYLWRLISKEALLYTEMVTTGALLHGNCERFLQFDPIEHPVALQLGGSDPKALAACAKLAERWGYDEINLNCGCPSDRVQNGMIGACLMAHPQRVAACIDAMRSACSIEVTVKHRIGIDDMDDYQGLMDFITPIADTGCSTFIVHARKAWLQGLSPKENREIPPLNYERVYSLKRERPDLTVVMNGGITTIDECQQHLQHLDGVMIGREAYHNPAMLHGVDHGLFDHPDTSLNRLAIAHGYLDYCEQQLSHGSRLNHLSRHILNLFQGQRGARQFRRHISENIHKADADLNVIVRALEFVSHEH